MIRNSVIISVFLKKKRIFATVINKTINPICSDNKKEKNKGCYCSITKNNHMEKDFDFKQVPYNWAMCYVAECSRKDECMRYQVYLRSPKGRTMSKCVMPNALLKNPCPHFHPIRKMRVAVGFTNIFNEVKAKDIAEMRKKMANYLGSTTTFYRYRKGEIQLTPWQQQWVRDMFRRYGYTGEVVFDGYKEVYIFE